MILKAGTYRFNDVLDFDDNTSANLNWGIRTYNPEITDEDPYVYVETKFTSLNFGVNTIHNGIELTAYCSAMYDDKGERLYTVDAALALYTSFELNGVVGWRSEFFLSDANNREFILYEDSEVEQYFGNTFISNTNYNEVNKPLAEITYNGETIAQLNAGETATLSCKDKEMVSDVVVKVNETPIPDGYIKPEGTLTITENQTADVTEYESVEVNVPIPDGYIVPSGSVTITENGTVDVTDKAEVVVDVESITTPLPVEVSTEEEMERARYSYEKGAIFKYTGTSGIYENGTLYIVQGTG